MNVTKLRTFAVLVGASVALNACGGGGGGMPSAPPQSTSLAPYTGPAVLAAFTWGKSYLEQSQYVGPAAGGTVAVSVDVRMRDEQGLLAYAAAASDPHSGAYRRFLTPEEIGNRYGASPSDYAAVADYFKRYGLSVGGWPQREELAVSGPQVDMEKAFGTKFGSYKRAGQTFLGPMQQPHFSQALPVSGVTHLVGATVAKPYLIRPLASDALGMSPSQIANGFDYSGAYAAGYDGTGISVGIIGTGPISVSPTKGDVPVYGHAFNARVASVSIVAALPQPATAQNGNTGTAPFDPHPSGLATPPPLTALSGTCTSPLNGTVDDSETPTAGTCNPEDGEAQLDTEQVAGLAPGSNVLFYLAYNPADASSCPSFGGPSTCTGLQGLALADDEIQQAIADDKADVLSLSYGGGESDAQTAGYFDATGAGIGPREFAALAAEGIAVFVSSGDTGAEECTDSLGAPILKPCVAYPAADPSVVSVGGVNAPLDNTGKLIGPITTWGDNTTAGGDGSFQNNIGSGGGTSAVFKAPAWQASALGAAMREQPDLALMADPQTGPALIVNAPFGAQGAPVGGTSAAAPEAAAEWALVLQACSKSAACASAGGTHPYRLGNPAPLLYKLYQTKGQTPDQYAATFYDILYGTNPAVPAKGATPLPASGPNGCCTAGAGYDEVTGLGVPFAGHLIQAITGQPAP
ncbi:MAG TPA: protease pro-enzyme activation domain-containing protein [Candidatus Baltobacteraceae bacterium]